MFTVFPQNYKWSLSVLLLIASIGERGAEFGEVNWACARLRDRAEADDVDAWSDAWNTLADKVERLADDAERAGDAHNAARARLRACSYHQIADRLLSPDDPRKLAAFQRSLACFDRARPFLQPAVERVDVPYQGSRLPALFVRPPQVTGPVPAVVFFDGLDVNKEQLLMFAGAELARHGLAVLIVDGPGNGESLRVDGLTLRHDYEVPAAACIDYLETRPDVVPHAIGLLAVSLGGWHVARAYAFERRFAAAASWGGMWDYHAVWLGRQKLTSGSAVSADHAHICWMTGTRTITEALAALEPFRVEPIAHRITGPLLIVHGASDRQIPLADAEREFAAIPASDKHLVVLREEDFGAQHAQIDNMAMAHLHLFPWLKAKLQAAAERGTAMRRAG